MQDIFLKLNINIFNPLVCLVPGNIVLNFILYKHYLLFNILINGKTTQTISRLMSVNKYTQFLLITSGFY